MKLLAFDTSTEQMHVAVQHGQAIYTHTGAGGALASGTLIPAIQTLMHQAGLQFTQLNAICFGRGPGSFTGLRTACSVAQGLAFGAGVQVLPVDSLLCVADEARHLILAAGTLAPTRICAALDARMGELYHAYYIYDSSLCSINGAYHLKTPKNMVLIDGFAHTTLAGNARAAYGAQMPVAVQAAPHLHCQPTALAMLRLAPGLIAAGGLVDAQDALPLYIRDKVAQTTAERDAAKRAA